MQLPNGSTSRGGCHKIGCRLARRALAGGLAKGDVGTTMSPAPSLPARPPRTGARGVGRRIAMGALGFG